MQPPGSHFNHTVRIPVILLIKLESEDGHLNEEWELEDGYLNQL